MRRAILLAPTLLALMVAGPGCKKSAPPSEAPQAKPAIELPPDPVDATLAIHDVRLFDGQELREEVTVLVAADGSILEIGPSHKVGIPADAEQIDGVGHTLLPGLIDAHTHVQTSQNLRQALAFGVTTEIDMFANPEVIALFKKSEAGGKAGDRADVRSSGIGATAPGGHGTEYGTVIPTLTKPAEAPAFVDARIAEGSDFLKIIHDDGSGYGASIPTLDAATVKALVDAAHARDTLAVVHINTQAQALAAVKAGADGLAHVFNDGPPSPELLELVAARPVFVTDTLAVILAQCEPARSSALADEPAFKTMLTPVDARVLAKGFPIAEGRERPSCAPALAAVKALHEAGATILASTDAPNPGTAHGASLHAELEMLVEAGLTPKDALVAATAAPARVFGLEDRGRVAEGLRADLVLVAGDPTKEIRATREVVAVWKAGQRVDREAYIVRVRAAQKKLREFAQRPAPPGSESGLIADFETGELAAAFGTGWQESTDALRGGASTVKLEVVKGGVRRSKHALAISGVIDEAALPHAWSGAIFLPSLTPMHPENLSGWKKISFRARGEVDELTVMIFDQQLGPRPAQTRVKIGKRWKKVTVDIAAAFELDALIALQGLFIGGPARAGEFRFEIDDLRFE